MLSDKELMELARTPKSQLTTEQRSAIDALVRVKVHEHPICPRFVDSSTGTRYENMTTKQVAFILKNAIK